MMNLTISTKGISTFFFAAGFLAGTVALGQAAKTKPTLTGQAVLRKNGGS